MVKPVAWMETYKGEPNNLDWNKENLNYGDSVYDVVPLYTAPRELSDVEIHYEVDKWERQNNYKHDADVHKTLIDFARAILKKASEK